MRTATASLPENSDHATPDTLTWPRLAHVTEQPGLPIKFDSKRGCDQIRARIYHDARLRGAAFQVAMVLSEFVNLATFAAHPKQKLIARCAHVSRDGVIQALKALVALGVLDIDRRRTFCRYVFLASWRGQFVALPGGSRCRDLRHHDVVKHDISLEPIDQNLVLSTAAAAVLPAAVSPFKDSQQQQQIKSEQRIEGLIGACAARARKLKRPYDEADERQRLASGEIDVDKMQRLADELQQEIDERQYRRAR